MWKDEFRCKGSYADTVGKNFSFSARPQIFNHYENLPCEERISRIEGERIKRSVEYVWPEPFSTPLLTFSFIFFIHHNIAHRLRLTAVRHNFIRWKRRCIVKHKYEEVDKEIKECVGSSVQRKFTILGLDEQYKKNVIKRLPTDGCLAATRMTGISVRTETLINDSRAELGHLLWNENPFQGGKLLAGRSLAQMRAAGSDQGYARIWFASA